VQQRNAIGIFSRQRPRATNVPAAPRDEGKYVTTGVPREDTGIVGARSPMAAGLTLLGIYVAMYLIVAGLVHVLTSPDAAAIASERSTAPASTATASNPAVDADDSPSRHNGEPSTGSEPIRRQERLEYAPLEDTHGQSH